MNIRRIAFDLLDSIKGDVIRKYKADIQSVIRRGEVNYPVLSKLLAHASQSVPFYNGYVGVTELKDFPVINKSVLRENLESHLSTDYKQEDLAHTTISGSTGTPFTIYFDKRKRLRHTAALMYWNERAGAPLGQRMYYLRVWNMMNRKGRLAQLIENIIPVEVSNFVIKNVLI